MNRRSVASLAAGVAAALAFSQVSAEEAYPTEPVQIIVPYGAGGGTDIIIRAFANWASERYEVPVNVVNKPGGSGVIGVGEVLTASAPDGYTLLGDTHGASSMIGAFQEPANVPYDWRDRTWLGMIDQDPVIYVVKDDAPWQSLDDLTESLSESPARIRWGTTGRGGIAIPAMVQLFEAAGVDPEEAESQVMFESGAEGPLALAGGHIDVAAQQLGEVLSLIADGRIRPLATTADERLPHLPDVPTTAEAGYPNLDVIGWHGLSGPPGLPQHVVDFWVAALEEASTDPAFNDMLEKIGKVSVFVGPDELKQHVDAEYEYYLKVA